MMFDKLIQEEEAVILRILRRKYACPTLILSQSLQVGYEYQGNFVIAAICDPAHRGWLESAPGCLYLGIAKRNPKDKAFSLTTGKSIAFARAVHRLIRYAPTHWVSKSEITLEAPR